MLVRRTLLLPPEELLGSELEPEVSAVLRIDAEGRVTGVEVESITPSTDFDEPLGLSAQEQLGVWRFAPAIESGQRVASDLRLAVRFRSANTSAEGLLQSETERFFFGGRLSRESRILRLPLEERQKYIDRYRDAADTHVDANRRQTHSSPRFVVVTDAEQPGTAELLAGNLEAAYNTFFEIFGEAIEPYPERFKIVAYFFATRRSFRATQLDLQNTNQAAGFYIAPGFLAFHQEVGSSDELLGLMIHEVFHAFSDRHLRRPGLEGWAWIEEGLAEYFGNSEVDDGRLTPGRLLHRKFLMHYGEVYKTRTSAGTTLQDLKSAVRSGDGPSLEQLTSASRQQFYGQDLGLWYGFSWAFVHFLRHGYAGAEPPESRARQARSADPRFLDLFLFLYEGHPLEAALRSTYGLGLNQLEEPFREYLRRL